MEIIEALKKYGYSATEKTLIDVTDDNNKPIMTVFVDDKYIQFHDEFTQIGMMIPEIKKLVSTLCKGWATNRT